MFWPSATFLLVEKVNETLSASSLIPAFIVPRRVLPSPVPLGFEKSWMS